MQKLINMIDGILVERFFRVSHESIVPNNGYKVWTCNFWTSNCINMDENYLACEIRVARKIAERKDTNGRIPDLVKRNYDNKNHKQIIRASNILIVGTHDVHKILSTFL